MKDLVIVVSVYIYVDMYIKSLSGESIQSTRLTDGSAACDLDRIGPPLRHTRAATIYCRPIGNESYLTRTTIEWISCKYIQKYFFLPLCLSLKI